MADEHNQNPAPDFQPSNHAPGTPEFSSSEIYWWNNGIWGEAGYAIPNDGNKPTTGNETMAGIVDFIGSEMFNLMHRPDVKFNRPFNAQWLFDLNKMLTLGIKRLGDRTVGFTDDRTGDAQHAINTPTPFTVYPIPFFGGRIRQKDAKKWAGETLILLSELMQHSDNDFDNDVTDFSVAMAQGKLRRIRADMAMKYLGATREQVEAPTFEVAATAFDQGQYDPSALFTSNEMTQERMPELWWPEPNDLTPLNGIAITTANQWRSRWPIGRNLGDGAAFEAAWPGGGRTTVKEPGSRG